ncbi:MAG: RDD family protein [Gammaproteobacteria bacterium]|nr:RDD family protein [Gammaproteobacteria bacterium]
MNAPPAEPPVREPANLWRRLAAMIYDAIAVFGLLCLAAAFPMAVHRAAIPAGNACYQAYLLFVAYAYFAVCWHRGGQTVGMRPWRVRVVSADGRAVVSWLQTLVRFLVALLPLVAFAAVGQWSLHAGIGTAAFGSLGYLWSWWDPARRAWHDTASRTALVHEPKRR